ncbi:MAG: DUF3379 domain-containing protein [Pseudomonadota bacterium]|nr:DUF3379 domain-containing protein [Pseudomonadota bacterium]
MADPHGQDADERLHLASCPECTAYTARLLRFEERLARALHVRTGAAAQRGGVVVPLPSIGRKRIARPATQRRIPRGWLAAAASVLLAAVVVASLWLGATGPTLAADVVSHMAAEPQAWSRSATAVPQPQLDQVLRESHVRLKADPGLVSYANSCLFRGHRVPHLVVQTAAGPVTVMVLTRESSRTTTRFDERGYRGMILPVPGHGSVAALERGSGTGIDPDTLKSVAAQVVRAIDWTR